jgi:multisubunit Na+/H+ antiporter MnhG subunit
MARSIVVIGAVVLIVGVVIVAVGVVGVLRGLTVVNTFTQPQSGEYVSTELRLNATSDIAVTSAAANGGLIPAQDLSLVSSTNIGQYAIATHSSGAGTVTYTNLMGDYYYVAFATSQPSSKIVATPTNGGTVGSNPLVLGGFVVIIAGVVIMVLGRRMKRMPKNPSMQGPPAP